MENFDKSVILYKACKFYKETKILNELNMTVNKGHIYGLLGPSGCGKTTLLTCLIGIKKLNKGYVQVLGRDTRNGLDTYTQKRVGYMPQELGLVSEFTIKEVIVYFGKIYGLNPFQMGKRFEMLALLLELPDENRFVKNCSGGQKQRVSLAATLIHDPDLLILDEPTVGLDPVLCATIWEYLHTISSKENKTIIITTHYIEEARKANMIGLMRNGKIIAEESPDVLLEMFECDTLERVFLILSEKQSRGQFVEEFNTPDYLSKRKVKEESIFKEIHYQDLYSSEETLKGKIKKQFQKNRMNALLFKNLIQVFRNPSFFYFGILFIFVQLTVILKAVGLEINDLSIGIINREINWENCNNSSIDNYVTYNNQSNECYLDNISCYYLHGYNKTIMKKKFYTNFKDALDDFKKSEIFAIVEIPEKFSVQLNTRLENLLAFDENLLKNYQIQIWVLDNSLPIIQRLQTEFQSNFINFLSNITKACLGNPRIYNTSLNNYIPIYGSKSQTYNSMMFPGFVLSLVYFAVNVLACTLIIEERISGIWYRNLIAGVTVPEILCMHIVTQIMANVMSVLVTLIIIGFIYPIEPKGSFLLISVMLFLFQIFGIFSGLLISAVSPDNNSANFLGIGSFFPAMVLSGIFWPIEGCPKWLKRVIEYFPFYYPSNSLRSIINRGWNMKHKDVYTGYILIVSWSILLFFLILLAMKRKF